ncbi:alanine racemase [Rhodopila sp.]|jgi:alanine racemase|uniref:alanine racemase n=1 Tax=Rhodopila sp. TaxID=2480087 RepID=UPI002C30059A|nr:alanine racemase [Rhodopila sp.]HVZ07977.1 alanine racemase [Rhodopila sp.]
MAADTAHAVLEVDLGAIVANWRDLGALHPSGPVAGVVKADAYGLGARPVAAALYAAGCRHFFVAYLDEAIAIRDLLPDAMLAVLSGPIPGTESDYAEHGLTPVLGSLMEIEAWAGRGPAILHVDTGMSRLGLSAAELDVLERKPGLLAGLPIRFIMTHLVASEEPDEPVNLRQCQVFAAARARLPKAPASFANSSGILLGPDFGTDLARPGAALYGVNPAPGRPNPMRPVAALRIRVLEVRDIPSGASVGYNATWTASRPSRIATGALGYADGFHRALSGKAKACFDGTPVPLVGRISMDLSTFDVTDLPAVRPGSWLDIIGPHQTVDDLAALAGTNGYEILTSLGRRFRRVYLPA